MLFNTKSAFGWLAIILHWLSAVLIVGLFGLGLWMMELDYYHPWRTGALLLHKSIGVCFFFLVVFRLLWRLFNPQPQLAVTIRPVERILARIVQACLYLLMFCLPLSGYFMATSEGHPVQVFGVFSLSATLVLDNSSDLVSRIHAGMAWIVIGLALLHASAALKHHLFDKDDTLIKMLGFEKGE